MDKIAVSTGEIDKRTVNGNNGTRRGPDKAKRTRVGFYVLKDEIIGLLKLRCDEIISHYGGAYRLSKLIKVTPQVVIGWQERGRISSDGAHKIHRLYVKDSYSGFRANYCRPDLKFDPNGRAITKFCDRRHMLTVKR